MSGPAGNGTSGTLTQNYSELALSAVWKFPAFPCFAQKSGVCGRNYLN